MQPLWTQPQPWNDERRRICKAMLMACVACVPGACASDRSRASREPIVEAASGRAITRMQLLDAMRASDFVLLGELHDNPRHHALHGELLAALGPDITVVAEHLPRGRRVSFGVDLRASLTDAGFDPRAWRWPMHEPLFSALAASGATVVGGNAPRELVREVARGGLQAVPAELKAILESAPLDKAAQDALDSSLVDSHCGKLPLTRVAGLRWAQRVRDASMWLALSEATTRRAALVAGDSHVRTDYGVPQLIARLRPQARVVSVGFVEAGSDATSAPYTYVWFTDAAERDDPCAAFPAEMPAAPSQRDGGAAKP